MAPKKVTVNAVAPGVIETEMSARVRDAAGVPRQLRRGARDGRARGQRGGALAAGGGGRAVV